MGDSPAALIYDVTGTNPAGVNADGEVSVRPDGAARDKVVGVSFFKEAVAATTYYMGIDLSNTTDYKHIAGDGIQLVQSIGKAFKTNAGSKWRVQLLVVARIDGTDADLVVLPQASMALQDTSKLSIDEQIVNLWPNVLDLTIATGDLTKNLTNAKELNIAAVNTGVNLSGTLDFAFGIQYWVE
jgi:hypothetical protein